MEEDIKKKILEKHYQKSKMGDYLNDNTMKYVLDAMEEYARLTTNK